MIRSEPEKDGREDRDLLLRRWRKERGRARWVASELLLLQSARPREMRHYNILHLLLARRRQSGRRENDLLCSHNDRNSSRVFGSPW